MDLYGPPGYSSSGVLDLGYSPSVGGDVVVPAGLPATAGNLYAVPGVPVPGFQPVSLSPVLQGAYAPALAPFQPGGAAPDWTTLALWGGAGLLGLLALKAAMR